MSLCGYYISNTIFFKVLREDSKNVKTYRVSPLKTFLPVNVSCVNGVVDVNFSVRAVTEDGKRLYRGAPSAPKTVVMCTGMSS